MKKSLLSLIVLVTTGLFGCRTRSADDIDGGVVKRISGDDAPKVIESEDIVSFDCELSFIAAVFNGESEHDGRVYKLSAVLQDDRVKVKIDWRDRSGKGEKRESEADSSFMRRLHGAVHRHDLAKHNGYYHSVSGLPYMYGDRIDIKYASGESIYAFDNQSSFLSVDAAVELTELFVSMP